MKEDTIISIESLSVDFGDFKAIDNISFEVRKSEFFSILGPSGSGKTTLLRVLAGFQKVTKGNIYIENKNVTNLEPINRPTSLVFQNLALFPLMTVEENIGFSLKMQKKEKSIISQKVEELLEMVQLKDYKKSKISELSGGQKQRVAICRSLAASPKILLLDEPLSALDFRLRRHMREELKSIQKLSKTTFIYITHDQSEALAMSDRVSVINQGKIMDLGTPSEIYKRPKSLFTANFIGETNQLVGTVLSEVGKYYFVKTCIGDIKVESHFELRKKQEVYVFLRPEKLKLQKEFSDNYKKVNLEILSLEGSYYKCKTNINGIDIYISAPSEDFDSIGRIEQLFLDMSNLFYALPK